MQLRAELVIRPDEPDRKRVVSFCNVGINRLSQFCTIGVRTLHQAVRDNRAVELLTDSHQHARRTVNRDGIRRSLGCLRMTFRLGDRSREALVYIIPDSVLPDLPVLLEIGTDVGEKLGLVEPIWEVSSDSADSEVEEFMIQYPYPRARQGLSHHPQSFT